MLNQRKSWEMVKLDDVLADYVGRNYPGSTLASAMVAGAQIVLLLNLPAEQEQTTPASPPEPDEIAIARAILKSEEGIEYVSYLDAELSPTGGIGHLLSNAERSAYPIGTTIPAEIVDRWFEEDVSQASNDAIKWLGPATWAGLSSLRRALALCLAYQLGWDRLQPWDETRNHIRAGEWADVAAHLQGSLMGRKQASARTNRMAQMWVSGLLMDRYET